MRLDRARARGDGARGVPERVRGRAGGRDVDGAGERDGGAGGAHGRGRGVVDARADGDVDYETVFL